MARLPNMLSIFRLILVPVFPLVYFFGRGQGDLYAGIVFLAAGISDILDGFIARRFHCTSALGRILDPLADKLMQLSVMTTLTADGRLPIWFFIVFTLKEMVMLLGGYRLYRMNADVIPSNVFGKATAVLFYIVLLAVLFLEISPNLTNILLAVLLSVAIFATGIYYTNYKSTVRK